MTQSRHALVPNLSSRIAIVTGASAGIGREIARHLASLGASVVVNARRRERLDELVSLIQGEGGRAFSVPGDAADPEVISMMIDTPRTAWGRDADLVVINAGRGLAGSPLTSDPSQWEEMIRTNYTGAAHLVRAAAQRMLEMVPDGADWQAHPRDIIAISSNVGKHISPFSSMYGSTKFALSAICEAVRRELAPRGIRVSAIHPGVVRSEFQQVAGYDPDKFGSFMDSIGPVLEPIDIARTVAFIASQPPSVCINDVMLRPTRQDYP